MRLVALLAALLLAGCAGPGAPAVDPYAERAPEGTDAHEVVVHHQQVFESPPFGTPATPIHARITWNASHALDAWIATGDQCTAYGTRGFAPTAQMLNTTGGVLSADLPAGVSHCFIVDNADFALGAAAAGPDANLSYRLDVWRR